MISAVQFDHSGDFLASGDRAGRVVMFERNQSVSSSDLFMYFLRNRPVSSSS